MSHTQEGSIKKFWPDNTEKELWINTEGGGVSINDLIQKAKDHFGDGDLSKFEITAEHVHTDCLGYDRYDPSDYTNFVKIEKID